jgi:hypothetical protein
MKSPAIQSTSGKTQTVTVKWLASAVLLWFVTIVLASGTGLLARLSPYAVPPVAFTLMVLPAILFWRDSRVRVLIEQIGLRRLTALHIFRILAVPLFFWYGGRGLLPQLFVDHAGWGDLISGIAALGAVALWPRPAGYWIAHLIGMADFIVAFATAMAVTRTNPGSMAAVSTLPVALIPFFFVGLLGSTHLMAYDLLLRGRGGAPTGGWPAKAGVTR